MLKILTDDESRGGRESSQPNGRYANDFTVGHNAFEFLIDFAQTFEDRLAARHTTIITTPVYAKSLLELLKKSIDQYEHVFGTIPDGDG